MSTLVLLLKIALVFGLLALVLWVLKRTDGLGARAKNGLLEVRGSTRLGKGAALTVVRLDGKDLLLGVTDHTVTLLSSEDAVLTELPAQPKKKSLSFRKDLPDAAVAAALASLRGETPAAVDGSAAAPTPAAARRQAARTDALRDEEHPWNHACRPTFRAADGDDALL
jgi:flagellar protein FliO/FliZ